jgi:hypothetical protein
MRGDGEGPGRAWWSRKRIGWSKLASSPDGDRRVMRDGEETEGWKTTS